MTHWHQPLCPVGPIPVAAGDRLKLTVEIADAAGQKMKFSLLCLSVGRSQMHRGLPRVWLSCVPGTPGAAEQPARLQPSEPTSARHWKEGAGAKLAPDPLQDLLLGWHLRWQAALRVLPLTTVLFQPMARALSYT